MVGRDNVERRMTPEVYEAVEAASRLTPSSPGFNGLRIDNLARMANLPVDVVSRVVSYHQGVFDETCIRHPPLTDEAAKFIELIESSGEVKVSQNKKVSKNGRLKMTLPSL